MCPIRCSVSNALTGVISSHQLSDGQPESSQLIMTKNDATPPSETAHLAWVSTTRATRRQKGRSASLMEVWYRLVYMSVLGIWHTSHGMR